MVLEFMGLNRALKLTASLFPPSLFPLVAAPDFILPYNGEKTAAKSEIY